MSDQKLLITALHDAGRVIAEYLQPGPRDADKSIQKLIAILDRQDLAAAMRRLEDGHGMRLVK